jgi:hypothetical protein
MTIPNTFTSGTLISASEVNENFAATALNADLASGLPGKGAALIGTTDEATVQLALNARVKTADLAATTGAALVGTTTGETVQTALTAASSSSAAHGQAFWRKIRAMEEDCYVFINSDSTWNGADEPLYRWVAEYLAPAVPTHTIIYRLYIDGSSWQSPVTVQTGTSGRTIYVDNCAIPGSVFSTTQGGKENDVFQFGRSYDLMLLNQGHNFGYLLTQADIYPAIISGVANLMALNPQADVFATLQNPWLRELAYSRNTQAVWRRVAAELGLGIIDVSSKFEALGNLNDPAIGGYTAAVTFTNGLATIAGTGLPTVAGTRVSFSVAGGTLPTNFVAGTTYYVLAGSTSSSITVSATAGGVAIVAGSAGSGTPQIYVPGTIDFDYYTQDGFGGLHPSVPTGVNVALPALAEALAERELSGSPTLNRPLSSVAQNLLLNPAFTDWTGSTPAGYTFTNCTPAKSVAYAETGLYGMSITPGAGTNPVKSVDVSSILPRAKKRWLTYMARIWVPAGMSTTAGRVQITTTGASNRNYTSLPVASSSTAIDGWRWVVAMIQILDTDQTITLNMLCGAVDGSDNGDTFYVDREVVLTGLVPADLDPLLSEGGYVSDIFNNRDVGVPTGYTGTLVVTGNNVSLTGATVALARAYGNLRTVVGRSYRISWGTRTVTGLAGVSMLVRGPNGGGTVIATASNIGSNGSLTFTATGTSHSWLLSGGSNVTAFTVDSITVTDLSTGITVPAALPLTGARNSDLTTVDATGGVGKWKFTATIGTSAYLASEAAQGNTKTDTAVWEYVLPPEYIPARDLTITVNSLYSGTGTAGTKTAVAQVYRLASDGTSGANLVTTAAATTTTSAADYTFAATGTTLSPGDRIQVVAVGVIQETAGVNPLTARINSVRVS